MNEEAKLATKNWGYTRKHGNAFVILLFPPPLLSVPVQPPNQLGEHQFEFHQVTKVGPHKPQKHTKISFENSSIQPCCHMHSDFYVDTKIFIQCLVSVM
jgi:hypothetical protein